MKASLIIIILLTLNTSAILIEPISVFVKGINTWILVVIEFVLGIIYYINWMLKDIRKSFEIELNRLNFYPKSTHQNK